MLQSSELVVESSEPALGFTKLIVKILKCLVTVDLDFAERDSQVVKANTIGPMIVVMIVINGKPVLSSIAFRVALMVRSS